MKERNPEVLGEFVPAGVAASEAPERFESLDNLSVPSSGEMLKDLSVKAAPYIIAPLALTSIAANQMDSDTVENVKAITNAAQWVVGIGGFAFGAGRHAKWRSDNLPEGSPVFSWRCAVEGIEWGLGPALLINVANNINALENIPDGEWKILNTGKLGVGGLLTALALSPKL